LWFFKGFRGFMGFMGFVGFMGFNRLIVSGADRPTGL
jgi:hypothetical protein